MHKAYDVRPPSQKSASLMVRALDNRLSGLGSNPGLGQCVLGHLRGVGMLQVTSRY